MQGTPTGPEGRSTSFCDAYASDELLQSRLPNTGYCSFRCNFAPQSDGFLGQAGLVELIDNNRDRVFPDTELRDGGSLEQGSIRTRGQVAKCLANVDRILPLGAGLSATLAVRQRIASLAEMYDAQI
jgi:hypothetical protein